MSRPAEHGLRYLLPGEESYWRQDIENDIKELITAMVSTNADDRPEASDILNHPYFSYTNHN